MKQQRWYERRDGLVYIYDQPYPDQALSVSIVLDSDLVFYRNNFNLTKVWSNEKVFN